MRYIQPFPGHYVSMDPTAVIDVYGLIGTPAMWKEHATLVWRVGPAYLFEEVLSPESVGAIYTQGTAYVGNFQALRTTGGSHDQRVILASLLSVLKDHESLICAVCYQAIHSVVLAANIQRHANSCTHTDSNYRDTDI